MGAAKVLGAAEVEHDKVIALKKKTEKEHMIAEGRAKAQELQENVHAEAQNEIAEMCQQALKEIKATLARIDTIRAATDEELKAQRIFTNIARKKANTPLSMLNPSYQLQSMSAINAKDSKEPVAAATNGHSSTEKLEATTSRSKRAAK